jgi:two-component system, NarL family, response regulator
MSNPAKPSKTSDGNSPDNSRHQDPSQNTPLLRALLGGKELPKGSEWPLVLVAGAAYNVLVADDLPIVREGLITLINRQPDMRVVCQAGNGSEAVQRFVADQPDVAIVDLRMTDCNGIGVVAAICEQVPSARLVIFTASQTEEDIYHALRAGAQGYLLKSAPIEEVVQCIRAVADGKSWIPSAIAAKLAKRVTGRELTRREIEVLRAIAIGKSNKEIGSVLGISEGTVKVHVTHILEKLKAGGRTEAINFAVKRGLVHMDRPLAA